MSVILGRKPPTTRPPEDSVLFLRYSIVSFRHLVKLPLTTFALTNLDLLVLRHNLVSNRCQFYSRSLPRNHSGRRIGTSSLTSSRKIPTLSIRRAHTRFNPSQIVEDPTTPKIVSASSRVAGGIARACLI
ncbi:hypothetical protein BDV93DRAFT_526505 [Ceratobasidium sp. AG-I]|nr:hypothetical protein BDV93DRAFT_526505 [Ceratobasidium sp. AG-I]